MVKNLEFAGFKRYEEETEDGFWFFFLPSKGTKKPLPCDVRIKLNPKEPEKVQAWAYNRRHGVYIRKTFFVTRNLKKQADTFVNLVNKIRKIN